MADYLRTRDVVKNSTIDAAAKLIEKNQKLVADNMGDIEKWLAGHEPAPVTQPAPTDNYTTTSATAHSKSSASIGLLTILLCCIIVI